MVPAITEKFSESAYVKSANFGFLLQQRFMDRRLPPPDVCCRASAPLAAQQVD